MIVLLRLTAACTVLFTAEAPTVAFEAGAVFLLDTGEATARDLFFADCAGVSGATSVLVSGVGYWCGMDGFLFDFDISGGEKEGKDVRKVGEVVGLLALRRSS